MIMNTERGNISLHEAWTGGWTVLSVGHAIECSV